MKKSKNLHGVYVFPILYVVSLYLFPVFSSSENFPILSYFKYTPFIFGILNIIIAVRCCKPKYHHIMLNCAVLVKFALIPFFVMGGILIIASFLISFIPVPFMLFFGPMVAFILCGIGWLILALGTPYTISYLHLSQKAGIRSKAMAVLHSILQFFFFIDIFDIMYLTFKENKWKKLTIILLVLLLIAAVLVFLLFAFWLLSFTLQPSRIW